MKQFSIFILGMILIPFQIFAQYEHRARIEPIVGYVKTSDGKTFEDGKLEEYKGNIIPNTDVLIDELTARMFGEKSRGTFTFLNNINKHFDIKKQIDILGGTQRFAYFMHNSEGPERLTNRHTIPYNTKVTFSSRIQPDETGKISVYIYPIDWEKSTIDIQSPVRNIESPLYLIADPILDMHILAMTLVDSKNIHQRIDISQVQRKYHKVSIDTYRQNVYIPMDDAELMRVKKELFPGTGTMMDAYNYIDERQSRREIYGIFPYYTAEIELQKNETYLVTVEAEKYRQPEREWNPFE